MCVSVCVISYILYVQTSKQTENKKKTDHQLKAACGMSIAISLASILFIHPGIHEIYPFGYWGGLTAAFVSDTNIGATFQTSILRLEGTFLGVTIGFIILKACEHLSDDDLWYNITVTLLLYVWVLFCGYYRSHPKRGYSGLVSAFTARL